MGHRDGGRLGIQRLQAAVWMLVRNLATELRDYGICVNELIPGLVDTDILSEAERPPNPRSALSGSSSRPTSCRWRSSCDSPDRAHRPELQPDAPRLAVDLACHSGNIALRYSASAKPMG